MYIQYLYEINQLSFLIANHTRGYFILFAPIKFVQTRFDPIFVDCSLTTDHRPTEQLLDELLKDINYRPAGKYRKGVRSILISLYEAQDTIGVRTNVLVAIPVPAKPDYWENEKLVTRNVVKTLRCKLLGAGIIKLRRKNFNGSGFHGEASCYLYSLNLPRFKKYLKYASVKSLNTNLTVTKKKVSGKARLSPNDPESKALVRLNRIISSGNVQFGSRVAIGGVNRRFSDPDKQRGGRFYGPYTNKAKSARLSNMTIGGSPVCEVDISACNPTLLAAIHGHKLPNRDIYTGFAGKPREVTKMFLVEMIGKGSCEKKRLTKTNIERLKDIGINGSGDLADLRDELVAAYPFLEELEKGVLDSETLAYHESEIIQQAILSLQTNHSVVACPMHDCLIVVMLEWCMLTTTVVM